MAKEDKSCWSCEYRKDKQISLFGVCLYFLHLGKPAKDIPEDRASKGCKYFVKKDNDKKVSKIIQTTIELFDGELLEHEKEKKVYRKKRVYKDTRHKYTKRKDW